MRHLMTRLAYSAREGYADFNAARQSLTVNAPLRMSRLTRRLMQAIPWEDVRKARCDNYRQMHERLGGRNEFPVLSPMHGAAPLCYPFWLQGQNLRAIKAELANEDIFIPTYWEDALPRTLQNSIKSALIHEALFLPIDQRMNNQPVRSCLPACDKLNTVTLRTRFGAQDVRRKTCLSKIQLRSECEKLLPG